MGLFWKEKTPSYNQRNKKSVREYNSTLIMCDGANWYESFPLHMISGAFLLPFLKVAKYINIFTYICIDLLILYDIGRLIRKDEFSISQNQIHETVGRKTLRNGLNQVPDLIQDISWEKGQHKKTPSKTSPATAR